MPTKKPARAEESEERPATQTLLAPPPQEKILDAVVDRVLRTLDVRGLSADLTSKLAEELLAQVRVDALVTSIMEEQREALTARLKERLVANLLGLE